MTIRRTFSRKLKKLKKYGSSFYHLRYDMRREIFSQIIYRALVGYFKYNQTKLYWNPTYKASSKFKKFEKMFTLTNLE